MKNKKTIRKNILYGVAFCGLLAFIIWYSVQPKIIEKRHLDAIEMHEKRIEDHEKQIAYLEERNANYEEQKKKYEKQVSDKTELDTQQEVENSNFKELTEQAHTQLNKLSTNIEYQEANENEKRDIATYLLIDLQAQGLIQTFQFDIEKQIFSIVYADGTEDTLSIDTKTNVETEDENADLITTAPSTINNIDNNENPDEATDAFEETIY